MLALMAVATGFGGCRGRGRSDVACLRSCRARWRCKRAAECTAHGHTVHRWAAPAALQTSERAKNAGSNNAGGQGCVRSNKDFAGCRIVFSPVTNMVHVYSSTRVLVPGTRLPWYQWYMCTMVHERVRTRVRTHVYAIPLGTYHYGTMVPFLVLP